MLWKYRFSKETYIKQIIFRSENCCTENENWKNLNSDIWKIKTIRFWKRQKLEKINKYIKMIIIIIIIIITTTTIIKNKNGGKNGRIPPFGGERSCLFIFILFI